MTLLLLVNLDLAGSDVAVTVPSVFGDLTTLFVDYMGDLRVANPTDDDVTTLVALDLPTVRSGNANLDDANTMYAEYLS